MTPTLSIVLCTYERPAELRAALASLDAQSLVGARMQIVVVDNSRAAPDRDALRRRMAAEEPRFVYIEEPTLGLSRARNIGTRRASGDVVAFLDDDAQASDEWAGRIAGRFGEAPDIAALGGPVRPIWPGVRPHWLGPDLDAYLSIVDLGPAPRDLGAGEWLAGTNIAFRRSTLIERGGFPENLGRVGAALLSNEETALLGRLIAEERRVAYDPQIVVHHRIPVDRLRQDWFRRRVFWQVVSNGLSSAAETGIDREAMRRDIAAFYGLIPDRYRGTPGLFMDINDPELFSAQLRAIAGLTALMGKSAADWGS